MSTMTELARWETMFTRMGIRGVPRQQGPRADLYDVLHGIGGGEPDPVLIAICDMDDRRGPVIREAP